MTPDVSIRLIYAFVVSSACLAWHQFDRRGSGFGCHGAADDAGSVAAILAAVHGIDLVVDGVVSVHIHERDVFFLRRQPRYGPLWCVECLLNQSEPRPFTDRT